MFNRIGGSRNWVFAHFNSPRIQRGVYPTSRRGETCEESAP
jgi:hypothetical protein